MHTRTHKLNNIHLRSSSLYSPRFSVTSSSKKLTDIKDGTSHGLVVILFDIVEDSDCHLGRFTEFIIKDEYLGPFWIETVFDDFGLAEHLCFGAYLSGNSRNYGKGVGRSCNETHASVSLSFRKTEPTTVNNNKRQNGRYVFYL